MGKDQSKINLKFFGKKCARKQSVVYWEQRKQQNQVIKQMIVLNDLKEITTSSTLNPQKFSSLRCKTHFDQFISWVSLENSQDNKLYCNYCMMDEKNNKHMGNNKESKDKFSKEVKEKTKSAVRLPQVVDFKEFLKNLYTYCTLDESDPGRFNSQIVSCLDGCRQQEKLKMFMSTVQSVREELNGEFKGEISQIIQSFNDSINKSIDQIKQSIFKEVEEYLEAIMSREVLAVKQFKERGCKLVLSAAKTAFLKDDPSTIENLEGAIRRLHSGKIEISYAREHACKQFKQFTSNLNGKMLKDFAQVFYQSSNKFMVDIESKLSFLPKKKQLEGSKSIQFQYLHDKLMPPTFHINNELSKNKSQASFKVLQEKQQQLKIEIPEKMSELNNNNKSLINQILDLEEDIPNFNFNGNLDSKKIQTEPLSLFATFSQTLRQTFLNRQSSSRVSLRNLRNINKSQSQILSTQQNKQTEDFSSLSPCLPQGQLNKSHLFKENINEFQSPSFQERPSHSYSSSIPKVPVANKFVSEFFPIKQDQIIQETGSQSPQTEHSKEQSKNLAPLKRSSTLLSMNKKEQQKNLLQQKHQQQFDCPYCISQKPIKHEIVAVVRVPYHYNTSQSNKISPEVAHLNSIQAPSCSFILGEADGHLNVYRIEGEEFIKGSRERAHKSLNGLAFGKTKSMFFTAGEGPSTSNYSSVKLWSLLSDSRINQLVEVKIADQIIRGLYFARETMRANLNRLSLCIWGCSKQELKEGSQNVQNELNGWNLNFASNGNFEGAKMAQAFSMGMLQNIEGVALDDDDGVITYTKKSLTLMSFSQHFDCLHKKGSIQFNRMSENDKIIGVRKIERKKNQQQGTLVVTNLGLFFILSDNLAIVFEKQLKDSLNKNLNLSKLLYQEADIHENSRFIYCYSEQNKAFYVFEGDELKQLDEVHSSSSIKDMFFYESGRFLLFNSNQLQICDPLVMKENSISQQYKKKNEFDDQL